MEGSELSGLMKQKTFLNDKKLRKQINGKCNNIGSANEKKKRYHCRIFFLGQKLKSRVSFIQLKPILYIFVRGFYLSSCP
jgi:hypothetical protein